MPRSKTKAQLEAENKALKNYHISTAITSVINNLIRWGAIVGLGYELLQIVRAVAGKETTANILVKILANVTITQGILTAVAAGSTALYLKERSARRKVVQKFHPRIKELEEQIDLKRSSSTLTEMGDTNPSDEKWEAK